MIHRSNTIEAENTKLFSLLALGMSPESLWNTEIVCYLNINLEHPPFFHRVKAITLYCHVLLITKKRSSLVVEMQMGVWDIREWLGWCHETHSNAINNLRATKFAFWWNVTLFFFFVLFFKSTPSQSFLQMQRSDIQQMLNAEQLKKKSGSQRHPNKTHYY